MRNLVLICTGFLLLMASCGKNSSDYKALKDQNDSLLLVNTKTNADLDELMSLLNDVQDNFQEIKSAENYLSVQSTSTEGMNPTTRDRITSDMKLITETLKKNKDQIAELEKKLKNSGIQSSQLKKTIENLRTELNQKTQMLVTMQAQLAEKDVQIAELSESVAALNSEVHNLQGQTEQQQQVIETQDQKIKTAYYCFGTSKELKDQKILDKGQLGSNFNKEYFTKVKDITSFSEIPLFAKKAKVITKHPTGSYELSKEASGNLILKITNPESFWSIGRYLVIEVD